MTTLGTYLLGRHFKNPVWVGASELTMDLEGIRGCVNGGAGAVVAKSINENPAAAKQLDIAEYVFLDEEHRAQHTPTASSSLFNRSGLAQSSLDEWLTMLDAAQQYAHSADSTIIGSITVSTAEGAADLAEQLAAVVPIVEINVGAPHGKEAAGGAVVQFSSAEQVRHLVEAVRKQTSVPLIVKLPAGVGNVTALAAQAELGGADAVAMIGRFNGFVPDLETDKPIMGSWGAYGGPWGLPMSLYEVSKCFRSDQVTVPLIGTNGARSAEDVLRFILSGANAVELVSLLWIEGPEVIGRITEGLAAALEKRGLSSLDSLVGAAAAKSLEYSQVPAHAVRPEPWRMGMTAPSAGSTIEHPKQVLRFD